MSIKILLVEDEQPIREMLRFSLEKKGYEVIDAESAMEARDVLLTVHPDLMIVDWMMPEESGVKFIKKLKKDAVLSEIPILMLTARVEELDKVKGLDSGADDYMTKPVAIREFHSRIKALLRRTTSTDDLQTIDFNGIKLNLATNQLFLDENKVHIGSTEFKLIKFLLTHKNKVYSRSQLLDLWLVDGAYLEERTVDVHMLRLRKILKPYKKHKYIQTVRGMGYMFTNGKI